jgi:hypothetical protein
MRLARIAVVMVVAVATLASVPAVSARKLTLGMDGLDVRHLKADLASLGYLPWSAVDTSFDQRTWHAVVALQGWQRIERDGAVGGHTRKALRAATRPVPTSRRAGIEIHIDAQVMLLVRGGRVTRAIHVSSGAGGRTPYGRFAIYSRQVMSWSRPFKVWMPLAQYFTGGIALHENPSVPAYPASHGCVRIPSEESAIAWSFGRLGDRVWVDAGHRVGRKPRRPRPSPAKVAARALASAISELRPFRIRAPQVT